MGVRWSCRPTSWAKSPGNKFTFFGLLFVFADIVKALCVAHCDVFNIHELCRWWRMGPPEGKECYSQKGISSSWKRKSSSITKQIRDLCQNSVSRTMKIQDWSFTNSAHASFCHLHFKTRKSHKQIYHTTSFQLVVPLPSQTTLNFKVAIGW